jgi:hypothetical protein
MKNFCCHNFSRKNTSSAAISQFSWYIPKSQRRRFASSLAFEPKIYKQKAESLLSKDSASQKDVI